MNLTVGSLFSGIGGLELGLERVGMQVKWQVEIDSQARQVLAHHWPEVQRFEDVTNVGRSNLPKVDVLVGGFPCQDLSVAGRRAGLAGERSGLWWQFHRIISELAPHWVVIENVPGLLSSSSGRDLGIILGALGKLGYGWAYRVLDAQWFGVAQRRRRVFIVGHSGDWAAPATVLLEPESCTWNPPPRRQAGQRTARTTTFGVDRNLNGTEGSIGTLQTTGGYGDVVANVTEAQDVPPVAQTFRFLRSDEYTEDQTSGTLAAVDYKFPKSLVSEPVTFNWQNAGNPGYAFTEDGTGPLDSSQTKAIAFGGRAEIGGDISPTLVTDSNNAGNTRALAQGMTVRRLTPLECSRLQGFPDHWLDLDGLSDSAKYRMLGNAVCVNVAAWIGRRIVEWGGAA